MCRNWHQSIQEAENESSPHLAPLGVIGILFQRPRVNELMMIPDGFGVCLLPPFPVPSGSQMVAEDEVKFYSLL